MGSVLFTLVFLSQSDAGVCRHAWRLSRCGLQHQDHYRENKKQGETEGLQVKAIDSERDRKSKTEFITLCIFTQHFIFSCCHHVIAISVTRTSGIINNKEVVKLL